MSEPNPPETVTREPLLRVEDLRVAFIQYERGLRRRVVEVISGMDLCVAPGELVAMVGASGAGKTLLAHAVLGILPPNAVESGQVWFDGAEIGPSARSQLCRRGVSLLPQSVTYLDPMTDVGRQLRRAAQLAGRTDVPAAASEALATRALGPEVARLRPHELSGGMARRVLDALATMGSPRLLFADEPTPGLDEHIAAAALDRLRAMADAGAAVVLITHDLIASAPIADRVVVCRAGRTIESVPTTAFTGDGSVLTTPYARALWQALPANGFRLADTSAGGGV